jgi:hypothetical protein
LTPLDIDMQLAGSGGAAEATDIAMVFGPLTRVLPSLSAQQRDAVRATLEAFFGERAGPHGVAVPAAFWVVQART